MSRHSVIEADIRNLERQHREVASAEERAMLELMLGDRRADLNGSSAYSPQADRTPRRGL